MKSQTFTLFVALAIVAVLALLPNCIRRERVDRWFMPGEMGREAERQTAESRKPKPDQARKGGQQQAPGATAETGPEPSALDSQPLGFLTRSVYAVRGDGAEEWLARNGLMERFNFSHNLGNLFPPSLHAEHPEFFPLEGGVRLRPPEGSYFWNPDLGREDVAAWAADAARRHFAEHPDAVSFALGVNDGLIFGESEETMALISRGKLKAESRKLKQKNHRQNPESRIQNSAEGIETASLFHGITASPRNEDEGAGAPTESPFHRVTASPGERSVRFFRERPDFTNLVYTFTNRVAEDVARTHPDKYLGALAYYWCENAPDFPLHPNVVPFLTADRSQGYDEGFRREERELQQRWARAHGEAVTRSDGEAELKAQSRKLRAESGTPTDSPSHGFTASPKTPRRRLGLYDYLYGSGFLIPRVHTRLIADNLRQAWRLGFTDYFAEMHPNWGLDGPAPWLVAQLLQDPEQSREVLLDEYYSRFFRAAAVPMRRFFERCERQWMAQPGRPYWLKHYRNESQARLFPSVVCRELRALLGEAERQARDTRTRARVGFVSEAFGVTERFVAFCEARDRVNRSVLNRSGRVRDSDWTRIDSCEDRIERYRAAREEFVSYTKALREREPHAIAPFTWEDYLRHQPPVDREAVFYGKAETGKQKAETGRREAQSRKPESEASDTDRRHQTVCRRGAVLLRPDRGQRGRSETAPLPSICMGPAERPTFTYRPVAPFHDLAGLPLVPARRIAGIEYGIALPEGWQCYVEPSEHHCATVEDGVLRLTGNKETMVYQWVWLDRTGTYRATVEARGRISPGTTTSLTMSWLDGDQKRLGYKIHRLPEGEWPEWVTLEVSESAPAGAVWIGIGFRVQNQMDGDWAEARGLRLEKQKR